jgi:hypothetical protein
MRMLIRTVPIVAVLLALTGFANAELVQSGTFNDSGWGTVNTGWTNTTASNYAYDFHSDVGGYTAYYNDATLVANVPTQYGGYDVDNRVYFSSGHSVAGGYQDNFQFIPLTAGMHYVLSADIRAWTGGNQGETATGQVRLYTLNGDQTGMTPAGGGWSYFTANTIQWTGTFGYTPPVPGDPNYWYNWHHETVSFDIPDGFNVGTQQGLALWIISNGVNGASFDNVSLVASPIPEPGAVALLATGLFGLLAYAWRKQK